MIWIGRVHGQSGFVRRAVELLRLHSSASIRVECYSTFLSRLLSVWSGCMHSARDETSRSLFSVLKHVVAFAARVEGPDGNTREINHGVATALHRPTLTLPSFLPSVFRLFCPTRFPFSCQPAPPDLRQHLSLPRTARRLGRRPSHSSGSLVPGEPTEEADSSAGGGGGVAGDLDVASPPDVLGSRSGFGVQEAQGIEPGPRGAREDGGGGVVGEGIRGCAEWAVSFSGSLQQGITTVQVCGGGHEASGRCVGGMARVARGEVVSS